MFDEWRHERRVARLRRQKQRISVAYRKDLVAAHKGPDPQEKRRELLSLEAFERQTIDDEIAGLQTVFYLLRAQTHSVAVPDRDDGDGCWEQRTDSHPCHLTAKGVATIRAAIRDERKARFDQWARWLPVAVTVGGGIAWAVSRAI